MIPTWVPAAAVMNVIEYLNVNITLYYNITYMHRNTECQMQLDQQHHGVLCFYTFCHLPHFFCTFHYVLAEDPVKRCGRRKDITESYVSSLIPLRVRQACISNKY